MNIIKMNSNLQSIANVGKNVSKGIGWTLGVFYAASTSLGPNDQVEITFCIPPATPSTIMNIEIRPPGGGAAIPFTRTVPGTITPVNVLH